MIPQQFLLSKSLKGFSKPFISQSGESKAISILSCTEYLRSTYALRKVSIEGYFLRLCTIIFHLLCRNFPLLLLSQ